MSLRRSALWGLLLALAVLVLFACSKQGTSPAPGVPAPSAPAVAPAPAAPAAPPAQTQPEAPAPAAAPSSASSGGVAAAGGGAIQGRVMYQGTPPAPKAVTFGAEKQCAVLHGSSPPPVEELVVGATGGVQWTLVYIKEQVPGDYPPPTEAVMVDQDGCIFKPHVAVARLGQPVSFLNSDPLLHNVRTLSKQGQSFNIAQPLQGQTHTETFNTPEIGIPVKCDVHFWMLAYLHVMPHPFFAVTGEDGSFTINGLPPGSYTLVAWHEKLTVQEQQITVQEGQTASAQFTLSGS